MRPLGIGVHELHKGAVKIGVYAAVKGGIIATEGILLQVFPELVRAAAIPVKHPEEGDYRFIELLHFLLQGGPEGVTLLPVTALHGIDVLRCGIPEVHGKPFCNGFLLDFLQDSGFLFGKIGLGGLFILLPKSSEHVTVRHCCCV